MNFGHFRRDLIRLAGFAHKRTRSFYVQLRRTLRHVLTRFRPHIHRYYRKVLRFGHRLARRSERLVFRSLHRTHRLLSRTYRHIHHHLAHRPHQHLMGRWRWYDRWHNYRFHGHVHGSVFAVQLLIVGVMVIGLYRAVQALSDVVDTWNFASASQFVMDDGIETEGGSARLKAQNYVSDPDTAALFHFDEASGTIAADSSEHHNDGAITAGSFIAGSLNGAVDLNGVTSEVRAPDSPSLSLTQQNTVEAWTKFNASFSAGSASQRQTIADKGAYQLYFDNETGKLTYELANGSSSTWADAAGNGINDSWDANGKRTVNASTKIGSTIYVGIGMDIGDAEVWRFNGTTWSLIGGGNSVNDSWAPQTFEGVYSLATDGTNIYAGLGVSSGDGEVWKFDGSSWTKIGGDAINSSWQVSAFEQVWALDYFGGALYAGLGSSANDAEVWRFNGGSWTKIGGDSLHSGWTTNYEMAASLTNDGTSLYAGLGASAGDAEVWRWNGTAWTKIGGDSLNGGWDATIETVRTLRYFGSTLYAGLGDSTGDADVYSWDGSSWTKIGGDAINSSWPANYEQIGAFAHDGTNLYAGLGTGNGDGEVWRFNGTAWSQIGGDGLQGSWAAGLGDTVNTLISDGGTVYAGIYDSAGSGWMYGFDGSNWSMTGGNYVNNSWGYYGQSAVQVMQHVGDYMYAGLGNTAGSAQVWRFNGTQWRLIGGQGVNNSWAANAYEQVMSMASYRGVLYVGLGTTANDAEVWEWNGTTWSQVGGDSLRSGWTTNYEEVTSLASYGGYLYAGLGASAGDGEVWRYDGTSWAKIGGDNLNSGWTTNYDRVTALAIYNGQLIAGLGSSAGEAELWRWNGASWAKIGGDTVQGSWDATSYEQVDSLMPYGGKLYAGLGLSADDAEVWEYNGSSWTKIGGDDLNSSWTSGTYERVKTLAVYNGDLYAGLGNGSGDGEVWRYVAGQWTKIGGNGLNGGWTSVIEEVESFSIYKGKLYVGTGLSANADALIYSWGNNGYLQSNTNTFDDAWRHVAATYDGVTMRLYINGVPNGSTAAAISLPDTTHELLIGRGYGGREAGKPQAGFDGAIDELRISTVARPVFTTAPYSSTPQTIRPSNAVRKSGIWHWDMFSADEAAAGSVIAYRLSDDEGATWKYWDGSGWVLSANTSQSNTENDTNAHISAFPVTFEGITWQAIFDGDGTQRVTLNSVSIQATSDVNAPSAEDVAITASKAAGGSVLAQNGWTNGGSPVFSWTPASDGQSGIKGYCAYLGTDATADPISTKGMLGVSPLSTSGLCQFLIAGNELDLSAPGLLETQLTTTTSPYYFSLRAIDNAGNISSEKQQFHFRFDNTPPSNPGFITAPSGFINTKEATLSWPIHGGSAPNDSASGVVGLQYRIGPAGIWYGDSHTGAGDMNDMLGNDGSYTTLPTPDFDNLEEGVNTVYFRTWDAAGNVTGTYVTGALKINTAGAPTEPLNVAASPPVNTNNSFAFSWSAPETFVGDADSLTYCYTFNTVPSAENCTFTGSGVTSLGAGPYATQPGTNTIYVVARDESSNINYASYATATFSANTPAPGMPLNADIVDVSIKATNNWRLALTWDIPSYSGTGVASYKIYRSTDSNTFTQVGSSSSTTYIDANLSQTKYYYKIRACDSTNNCGAFSSDVHATPTGRFTSPAVLVAEPGVSNITTKKATIRWSTDRASDSKVAIGTTSGKYSSSEIASSEQVSAHQIDLDNLSAGTTYYFVAKWTDEDGNTGQSQEYSFTTAPPPSLKEITTLKVGLTSASIQFTSKNATRVSILFGKSEGFGGIKTINTSTAESNYAVELSGLDDGTKYFYQIVSYDSEENAYTGSVFSFTTVPRPRISNLTFQPIPGEPTSTQKVSWTTNVPSTSTVTYGKVGTSGTDTQDSTMATEHEIVIQGLEDDSQYFLLAQSRDVDGNLAVSDRQVFRTALDTRPPKISDVTIEASIRGTGAEARGQVVVSWRTDEPSTSQVAYAEGSEVKVFNNRTAEDGALSLEHIVIVSDLPTSKVYSIQAVSRDRAGNEGIGEAQSAIIGRASDSVLSIVLNTLKNVFGF